MMKRYIRFLIVWAVNAALIMLANKYWPGSYVLGNAVIPPMYAAIFAGFLLTVFDKGMKPIIKRLIVKERDRFVMFGIYWFVNFVGIWLIARVSFLSGFGITAFYYAIALAFVTCVGQWLARQGFKAVKIVD